MKNSSKLILIILLCFTFLGCSSSNSTSKITKKFKEAGYTVNYNKSDLTTVTISESKNGKQNSQFIAYFEDDKLESIAYIHIPENSQNAEDMLIGNIYIAKDSDLEVNKTVKKETDKILDKLGITTDELADYTLDIYKEKGKSLSS